MYWWRQEAQYLCEQSAIDYFYRSGTSISHISHFEVANLSWILLFWVSFEATFINLFGFATALSPLVYLACSIMYFNITSGILCLNALLDNETYEYCYSVLFLFLFVFTFTIYVFDSSNILTEFLFALLFSYFMTPAFT